MDLSLGHSWPPLSHYPSSVPGHLFLEAFPPHTPPPDTLTRSCLILFLAQSLSEMTSPVSLFAWGSLGQFIYLVSKGEVLRCDRCGGDNVCSPVGTRKQAKRGEPCSSARQSELDSEPPCPDSGACCDCPGECAQSTPPGAGAPGETPNGGFESS